MRNLIIPCFTALLVPVNRPNVFLKTLVFVEGFLAMFAGQRSGLAIFPNLDDRCFHRHFVPVGLGVVDYGSIDGFWRIVFFFFFEVGRLILTVHPVCAGLVVLPSILLESI